MTAAADPSHGHDSHATPPLGADVARPLDVAAGPPVDAAAALPIDADAIVQARRRIAAHAVRTPVLRSPAADRASGATLFFKCENLQRMGAFKFRGALNALTRLDAAARRAGVLAFSSGNHAQAVALAGRLLGVPTVILMPHDAPASKLAATRAYQDGQPGAEVILFDRYRDDREALAREHAVRRGLTLVPPFDHPDVMAGQGTAAAELFEACGPLDVLLVCVGGGGLISGSAVAAAAWSPGCRVVGVEPAAGDDVARSLAAGRIVAIETPRTIADGAQTQACGPLTFAVMQRLVAQVVTVDDAALVRTMRFFAEQMKLVVEPTGCLAAAAALEGAAGDLRGRRVGVVVSGGNVDLARFASLLATAG